MIFRSSSRPDIVSITPIYENDPKKDPNKNEYGNLNDCSTKAIVSAVSKHAQRLTSIILAKEIKTDKLIRCDVIVDKIDSIRIKHTTTHLYLEDSPECFTVEALDTEGNTFTSLDGLPFEWNILNDPSLIENNQNLSSIDSRNVLRLSKFIESEYVVSDSIKQLEKIGLSGNKILIEGLKTGTANVQSKLLDSYYKDMKTPLVRLLVVANILVEPSHPVYLLVGATVKYNLFLIKQTSIDKINLPSIQYYFDSRNKTVTELLPMDQTHSTYVGLNLGSTEIVLIDRNMKEELFIEMSDAKVVVPPTTVPLHVVSPDYLIFVIKNWRSSWVLEVGRTYEIMVLVYTDKRQQIYPSDNLKIESEFDLKKFRSVEKSTNGSYYRLHVIEKGLTQARAFLRGAITFDNNLTPFESIARGDQDIELLDPIKIIPNILIFAYIPIISNQQQSFYGGNQPSHATSNAYEYKLIASGGSGSYHWQSRNTTIISVNNQGLVRTTATKIGRTNIIVTDTRNIDIESNSTVYVSEPVDLKLQACPVETQLGTKLYLNVQMNAQLDSSSNLVPISDCSRLPIEVTIKDESIFKFVSINSPSSLDNYSPVENSCAVIVLNALRVGSTTIKINTISSSQKSIIQLNSNELNIGSYSQLKSFKNQLVLAKSSSIMVNLFDGPLSSSIGLSDSRVVESSSHFVKSFTSDNSDVEVESLNEDFISNKFSYIVKCNQNSVENFQMKKIEFANVKFQISREKTPTNRCPLTFEYQIKVRCTQPHTLLLSQLFVNNDENSINDQLFTTTASLLKWKCPIKLTSNLLTAHFERPLYIQLLVRDSLNNIFDNFTSLSLEWNCDGKKLIERSTKFPKIRSLEIANSPEDSSQLILPAENDEILNTNRLFYQIFDTKAKYGDTKLKAILHLNKHTTLNSLINIKLVSDVKIQPEILTIFNHPSNVVPLSLSHGSGHFNAEIETVKSQEQSNKIDQSLNVLKINQLNEHNVIVSPLAHSGLAHLNIFDYCVPPLIPLESFLNEQPEKRYQIIWPPTATSKIQVAGINSIMVNYEDDKVEIGKKLKIYVQISDATGNLIKTSYFPLMGLAFKLANNMEKSSESSTSSIPIDNKEKKVDSTLSLASIEPLNADNQIIAQDLEYTAVFVLNAIRIGTVMIQFEAKSDGYIDRAHLEKSKDFSKLIRSPYKDIQIYSPLRVEPKYIELIRGAFYQVITTGGPNSPEGSIRYELVESTKSDQYKNIIEISSNGVVDALKIGQVKVLVKSVGMACVPNLSSTGFGCNSENKKERIYSQDYFVVKVVELKSIHIQTPIKSIKQGNEMPIYLMANDLTLNPLNFASCKHLKYIWKISDPHVATLHHPLLFTSDYNSTSLTSTQNEEIFENSFSLRFLARKSGHVKISVRIEFLNNYISSNTKLAISDSIDLFVFEEAYFTHLPLSYYSFKYSKLSSRLLDVQTKVNFNEILISPGSQFQVKTNLDKQAFKINYELRFYTDKLDDQFFNNKYCNNNTITVSNEGMINVAWLNQYDLKNLQQCTVCLLVSLFIPNEPSKLQQQSKNIFKQQTLSFTIKVKPIVYSMIRLHKNTLLRTSDLSINKFRIDRKSLIKNKLILDNAGIQMKWHVKYYDNLGDAFDVVSLTNNYKLNRNDLVDFSKMNDNMFTLNQDDVIEDKQLKNKEEKISALSDGSNFKNHLSLTANSYENSFLMKTVKQGIFIMELTPYASNLQKSKDYLGLLIGNLSESYQDQNLKSKVSIGYITCLNGESLDEDEYDESNRNHSNILNIFS
jgi:nuclear pore complex protein Nup210